MKKLTLLFIALLSVGALFQACDNTKTYADMLADEKDAINAFIKDNNIKVISQAEFEKDTVTDLATNEYVGFSNGVYMQIVDRGEGDTVKSRDVILVRFMEYDILQKDTTSVSNYDTDGWVDAFNYTASGTTVSGQFTEGNMLSAYGGNVPAGWLIPLKYIRDRAHVKLIVPSKMGHTVASQYTYPYFYDIRKFQIE
ncbi:DUF4827 domain-containing protein [uncultured Bacteroides sp.]|uniref:DUF4827 domain-containing protein n=1 Tax=uncultured Bacteroides sp. TaxID=162156 RepID=UPI002AA66771|nr:DUF4827 domain-containing protein [uncultured Bacteroides sp.]